MFVEEQIKSDPAGELNQARGINMWSELLGKAIEAKTLNEFMRNQVCFFMRWMKNMVKKQETGSLMNQKEGQSLKKARWFLLFLSIRSIPQQSGNYFI